MISRENPSEKIHCDIIAGAGKTSHSPLSPAAPEEKNVRI